MPAQQPLDVVAVAREALEHSPVFALRQLQVEQADGAMVISGHVNSFYQKQLAQEIVRSVMRASDSPTRIRNQVDVAKHGPNGSQGKEDSGILTRPPF
jgi:osmotically-inducible protein OsmY